MKINEKNLSLSLLIGAAAAILCAVFTGFTKECEKMQDTAFRLHILANSDSAADQKIKYELRDYIIDDLGYIFSSCRTKDETEALAIRNLGLISDRANEYLSEHGYEYSAVCTVEKCSFPTRRYGDYTLPAGDYDALKIVIGSGEGHNWWCVLFPSVCLPAAEGESFLPRRTVYESEKRKAELTAESLAEERGNRIEIKFALYEWLKNAFGV